MNVFYVVVFLAAMALMQGLIGGTRLLFCLPAFGLLALAAVASLRDFRRPRLRANAACFVASGLFFGYLLVRGLFSPVAYLAWSDLAAIVGALTAYLLVSCHVVDPRRRLWIVGGLLILAGVNLCVGARQFASGSGFMLFGFLRSEAYLGRASGLYICPNHLAGYLEVVGSLALAAALWSRMRPWIKLLFGYGALCCFGGLLMTASRGGFLSAGTALLTLLVLGLWRSRSSSPDTFKRTAIIVAIVSALGVGGITLAVKESKTIRDRASNMLNRDDARTRLWPAAVKQFQTAPWVGAGAGTYLYYGRLFRDPTMQLDPIHTHNDYLQLLAEYGLAGAAGLLLFLGAHLRWGLRAYRRLSLRFGNSGGSNAAALNIGALAGVAAMAVHSVVDFNLHVPANSLLMAFVFALLANPGRELTDEASGPSRSGVLDWFPRLVLPALGLVMLSLGLPLLPGEYYAEKARVALRDGQPMAALHQAELGLARERRNPYLFFYLGEARQTMADRMQNPGISLSFRAAAIEPYREGVKLFPQETRLLLRLGQALTMVGNLPEAGKVLAEAVRWDPQSGRVLTYYGYYLQRAGRLAEAQAAYGQALGKTPNVTAEAGFKQVRDALAADSAPQ